MNLQVGLWVFLEIGSFWLEGLASDTIGELQRFTNSGFISSFYTSPAVIPDSIGDLEVSLFSFVKRKTMDSRLKMSGMTVGDSRICQRISELIQECQHASLLMTICCTVDQGTSGTVNE